MVLRFGNENFGEPLWKPETSYHVQITAAETIGVEQRARVLYETAGPRRDMIRATSCN